jgi:predicted amidohydrolase YtcJ
VIALWLRPEGPPEHRVFLHGRVLTMDDANRIAQAIALAGDRIEAVGSDAEIERLIGPGTVIVDLAGRTVMPGFIDAHGHFPGSGMREIGVSVASPPIGGIESMAGLLAAMRAGAADREPGEWLLGFGYDDTLLAEGRHPTRRELDAVSEDHPIFLLHASGHMGVANSAALAAVGIDEATPNPPGGVIVKDEASGELTGLLEETAREEMMARALDISATDAIRMMLSAVDEYAAMGVTTAQSGAVDPVMLDGLALASKLGAIPFRLVVWPEHGRAGHAVLSGELDPASYQSDTFTVGAVKLIADGSIQGYTGYLSEPYHVPFHGDADYRGYPSISREELVRAVDGYYEAGWQVAIHGNGDASIDDILHAIREAAKRHPREDARPILIHAQMARDDQLEEMQALGVTPSFFSAHTYYWGDRHRDIFMGPERAARMSPTRSAMERGVRFSVHLDTPVVPMQPMLLVWSTVNRLSTSGQVIGPEQRLTAMEALRAVTIDAAWQVHHEADRGSLEPGKLADLIVLSGDPLGDPAAIRDIEVLETVVGGRTIYRRE